MTLRDALVAQVTADIERGITHGMQVVVAVGGEVVVDEAVGHRHDDRPMDRDTILCWHSASKAVTATAVALLVERGLVSYGDTVATYVPALAKKGDGKETITVEHVLTHRAGIPDHELTVPFSAFVEDGDWLDRVCDLTPAYPPGTHSVYHPIAAWQLLGELFPATDGRTFAAFCHDEIFGPAAMTSSSWGMPDERLDRFSDLYAAPGDEAAEASRELWGAFQHGVVPAGGLFAPAGDLLRFYLALPRLLQPSTLTAMVTRRVNHLGCEYGFGYGPMVGPEPRFGSLASAVCFGHPGWVTTTAFHEPTSGLTFVAAGNGQPDQGASDARFRDLCDIAHRHLPATREA